MKGHSFNYSYKSIETSLGEIFYIETETISNPTYTMILLHASYSSSEEFIPWFQALSFYNIRIIAIDQPGCGNTKGKPFIINSLHNLDKGGPCDVVLSVIKALDLKDKIIIGGYDWGAGISLSLCTKYPKLFDRAFIFLPSYAEPTGNELKCISIPVLIIWVDLDQFHIWSKWKILADKIPNKTVEIIKIKSYSRDIAGCCYAAISDTITRLIVMHFGAPDPLADKEEIINPIIENQLDTKGNSIVAKLNINFIAGLDLEKVSLLKTELTNNVLSVLKFKQIFDEIGDKIYDEYINKNNEICNIFRGLPEISYDGLNKNPTLLVQLKVWNELPKNLELMWSSPRFFKNRNVMIFIPCSPFRIISGELNPEFLIYNKKLKEKYLSPFGIVKSYNKMAQSFIIETIGVDSNIYELEFPESEIFLFNNGQTFKKDNLGHLELEDGIRANYSNPLVKAKLLEICFNLSEVISLIDYSNCNVELCQKEAILIIRKSLKLVSFYKGVDRARYGRTDCIGKLAAYGQAQCHGLSSTMSAYLYPFCDILGVEILYRGGYSFINDYIDRNDKTIEVSNSIEKHQWIQINLRPSMNSYVVDVWYQEQFDDNEYLFVEIKTACLQISYPHPKLLLKNEIIPETLKIEYDLV